jgi:hypothetical protein
VWRIGRRTVSAWFIARAILATRCSWQITMGPIPGRSLSTGRACTTTFPPGRPMGDGSTLSTDVFRPQTLDMWRIPSTGGQPERLTEFDRYIGYPTPIDSRTVLYIGVDRDGSGPWLWAFDVERKAVRRVTSGLERYSSISAASGGHRLIASRGQSGSHSVECSDSGPARGRKRRQAIRRAGGSGAHAALWRNIAVLFVFPRRQ